MPDYTGFRRVCWLLPALAAMALPAVADSTSSPAGRLDVVASAATVEVDRSDADRRFVTLPELSFRFQLPHSCAAPARALSLSVSVGDTRRALDQDALLASNGVARMSLELPAGQIAPVVVEGFCGEGASGEDDPGTLTLPALLSAAASLRCVRESGDTQIWKAVPLDVVLICRNARESDSPG